MSDLIIIRSHAFVPGERGDSSGGWHRDDPKELRCGIYRQLHAADRIKVQAVRAANGRIQGWAINRGNRELDYYGVAGARIVGRNAHALAMIAAQRIAQGSIR